MLLRLNLLMWNQTHALVLAEILIITILNLKLVILLEYRNITIFLRKVHPNSKKLAGAFYEKELQKTNKKV